MIVRDSSLWQEVDSEANLLSGSIRTGMVIARQEDKNYGTTLYLVEVNHAGRRYTLTCHQMAKFGHIYNYEQYGYRPSESAKLPIMDSPVQFLTRSGDMVVIAEIDSSEGIILGALKHPARKSPVEADKNEYASCFNGLTTQIKEDGSYKIVFNGAVTPAVKIQLKAPILLPPIALPDALAYNPLIAGSSFGFAADGSYEVTDGSKVLPQSIKIDKAAGKTTITSGLVTISMDKKTQKIEVSCIDAAISAKKSFKVSSAKIELSGLADIKIKGAKIAIGFGGVELIDSIIKLIDGIGMLIIPHHLGPCSPIATSPTWVPQIELIKAKLQLIKGSL